MRRWRWARDEAIATSRLGVGRTSAIAFAQGLGRTVVRPYGELGFP